MVEVVSNLTFTDRIRENSYWRLSETPRGYLIQATTGRYRDWYLDADETQRQALDGKEAASESNRYLVLCADVRESSYWTLVELENGVALQAAEGPFRDRYLDICAYDRSRSGGDFQFSRNFLIGGARMRWRLAKSAQGFTITPDRSSYKGWVLGYDGAVESVFIWKRSPAERQRLADAEMEQTMPEKRLIDRL